MPTALAADAPATLTEVGRTDLGARGLNSALALADRCAYVGSRGQGPVAVVDIGDPAAPRQVGSLPARLATSSRELRADPADRLLIVLSLALSARGADRFDLYSWNPGDCQHPTPVGAYDFGSHAPHEFFLWKAAGRRLLFTSMFGAGGAGGELQVIDISDPSAPRRLGGFSPPGAIVHSVDVDPDGKRAYLSMWTAGLAVADVSDFTQGAANPQVRLLTPAGAYLRPLPGGNVHSAVPLADGRRLLTSDERYPPNCPYGPARIVDAGDPAHLSPLATLKAPENEPGPCSQAPAGAYTSHNPTLTRSLAFVSWYSSGLQVFDVSDPAAPVRLAEFRPAAAEPGQRDPALGVTQTMTWSYPILRDGLVYVADVNQGLEILRYQGPHQDEVGQAGFREGNSNLTAPSPAPAATASPAASAATQPSPSARAVRAGAGNPALPALLLGGLLLAAVALLLARARRGPG